LAALTKRPRQSVLVVHLSSPWWTRVHIRVHMWDKVHNADRASNLVPVTAPEKGASGS